ncbi:synaptonemal complex central element protein 1 [Scleropages formosus]|uniref:synaptonemal complex central element protein 1 n=1 Tax=Scleropages formosus TaxID=113540 RepID=UPI0010FA9B19|nr:synaptonemal complex central element protein 1 [Scleropages formosus]
MSLSLGGPIEPRVEELQGKLKELQRGRKELEEELQRSQTLRDTLEKEHEALCTEAYKLEVTRKEREDSYKTLKFAWEDVESDLKRQQQLNSKTKELIQQYTFHIQETKLKHRKLRMKFENQLQQLMDQHKHLASVYSPERLPAEVENAEKANEQLLKAEELKLIHLNHLSERTTDTRGPDLRAQSSVGSEEAGCPFQAVDQDAMLKHSAWAASHNPPPPALARRPCGTAGASPPSHS